MGSLLSFRRPPLGEPKRPAEPAANQQGAPLDGKVSLGTHNRAPMTRHRRRGFRMDLKGYVPYIVPQVSIDLPIARLTRCCYCVFVSMALI
jgi:hypothetical protein